ncbi:hypothetical protein BA904_28520 [Klebsiella pneumoniae]|nr:hypothetical protein BA904_28520 [Klebsiella pneumoniae]
MSSTLREASKDTLQVNDKTWHYYSLPLAEKQLGEISRLPKSLKVLMENLLRWQDGDSVTEEDIRALAGWLQQAHADREIAYRPARVLMQDFTGVPAVVDLAAMREAVKRLGGDTAKVNPLSPVDLVIDHSVTVDRFGDDEAFEDNVRLEMERNHERYAFLRWGQQAFSRFSVVPPGTGICHQVNLEYLGRAVWSEEVNGQWMAWPDTLVGTDSHTTMINGLGVLGWGVGGIEAEAAMLGQPVSMLIPDVVGFTWCSVFFGTVLGTQTSMTLGVLTAAIAGSAFPGHEVSYLVGLGKSQAMAMVIYFAICFGKITFTTLNAYGSFMSLTTIVSAFRRQTVLSQKCRIAFVVLMVTASCIIALLSEPAFLKHFTHFLLFLLAFFVPWSAICLTDYYLISKGAIDIPALSDPQQRYGFWNLYAITLYIVGVLIQLPFIENPLFHGSLTWIFAGNDVSWIIGWFGTGVLYYALRRFDRRSLPAQSLFPST